MSETNESNETDDVQMSDADAEAAFGAEATAADSAVSDRLNDSTPGASDKGGSTGGDDKNDGAQGKEAGDKGKTAASDEGLKKPGAEAQGDKTGAEEAKAEAEATAKAQQEAEQRAIVAAQAESTRKAQEEAARQAASMPMDATGIAEAVREAIKDVKIEGYDNFAAFEKEYGKGLTEAITAISANIAKQMVAPIIQERQVEVRERAHNDFVSKIEGLGHTDVRQLESDQKFWGWLDKPENSNLKYLVERADVKGTDLVLKTYKAEMGIQSGVKPVAKPTAADSAKSERERLVESQREAQKRSDSVHTATGRRQTSVPKKSGDEDITDQESAEKAFDEESRRVQEKDRQATVR